MTTFKVGDNVRLVGDFWGDPGEEYCDGALKTVTGVDQGRGSLRLQLEGNAYYWFINKEFAVELVDETPVSPTLEQRVLRLEELLRTLCPGVEL